MLLARNCPHQIVVLYPVLQLINPVTSVVMFYHTRITESHARCLLIHLTEGNRRSETLSYFEKKRN